MPDQERPEVITEFGLELFLAVDGNVDRLSQQLFTAQPGIDFLILPDFLADLGLEFLGETGLRERVEIVVLDITH